MSNSKRHEKEAPPTNTSLSRAPILPQDIECQLRHVGARVRQSISEEYATRTKSLPAYVGTRVGPTDKESVFAEFEAQRARLTPFSHVNAPPPQKRSYAESDTEDDEPQPVQVARASKSVADIDFEEADFLQPYDSVQ